MSIPYLLCPMSGAEPFVSIPDNRFFLCYTLTVNMTIKNKRQLNEKKFPDHKQLPGGGRIYWLEVKGRH